MSKGVRSHPALEDCEVDQKTQSEPPTHPLCWTWAEIVISKSIGLNER